jgi:hypothetical protein
MLSCIKMFMQNRHAPGEMQLGINSHTYIADESQNARDEFYPPYSDVMNRIGMERGWPPVQENNLKPQQSYRVRC